MSRMLRAFLENESGIRRFLSRRVRRPQDVDDLTQETFLRAYAAEGEQDVAAPRAYLYRVAKNLALNEKVRHANTRTSSLEDEAQPPQDVQAPSGEAHVYGRQKLALFAEAVDTLPPQCREVFLLRKVHGLSQKEVARRLGVSEGTVEKHVAAGLVKCAQYLRQRGYDAGRVKAPKAARARAGSGRDV